MILLNIKTLLLLILTLVFACSTRQELFINYSNSQIVYSGRIDSSQVKGVELYWSGTSIKFNFEGESISDITAEIIHQKQIEEQITRMQRMLNKRFGPDTWDEIIELRETRRKENKVKRAKAKEAFLERQAITRKRTLYWLQQAGNTIILGLCVAGLWWGLAYLVECAGKCF